MACCAECIFCHCFDDDVGIFCTWHDCPTSYGEDACSFFREVQ